MLDRTKHLSEILASPNEAVLSHSSKFDGFRLSSHFSLGELTKTSFKTEDNNEPPLEAVENLIHLCEDWLEELRFNYNTIYVLNSIEDYYTSTEVEPLVINQGFRSYQVILAMEKAGLNPSKTSNHMRGCAVDIRCIGVEHALRMMVILLDIADQKKQYFDELFLERKAYKSPQQRSSQQGSGQQVKGSQQQGTPVSYVYWLHFAARPKDNRRKIGFILK